MVNLVFLAPGIEIASIGLVFRYRYLTVKRWISHGEGDANSSQAEHHVNEQSTGNKKAGGTRFFCYRDERAVPWVCAHCVD